MARELSLLETVIVVIAALALANLAVKNVVLEKAALERKKESVELNEELRECRGSNESLNVLLAAFKDRMDRINKEGVLHAGKD